MGISIHACTYTYTNTQGYVKRCRGYNKLFDEEKVDTIFSNVEAIYNFQKDFLRELEASINHTNMEDTQIGEVFVNNVSPESRPALNIPSCIYIVYACSTIHTLL